MSGLPKWLTAFKPVNMLILLSRWKWFSQIYWKNETLEKIMNENNNDTSDTHQHCRSQVEFVEELSDKYVYFEYIGDVFSLDVPQYVNKPFEVFVRRAYP